MTDRWHAALRRNMRQVDEVIVICGEHTADCERMSAELRVAREENKPALLLWGRRERMCSMPSGAQRSACMYSWTWEVLVYQVAQTLREARPIEVPEGLRRVATPAVAR